MAERIHHDVAADSNMSRTHRHDAALIRLMNQAANHRAIGCIAVVVPMQRVTTRPIELTHPSKLDTGKAASRMESGIIGSTANHAVSAEAVALRVRASFDHDVARQKYDLTDRPR